MLLYKYRTTQCFDRIRDILREERLYCPTYDKINDPCEGCFNIIHRSEKNEFNERSSTEIIPCSVDYLLHIMESDQEVRVCSFSSTIDDIRLWSHYADGHYGVAFEIDIPSKNKELFPVKYVPKIPIYDGHNSFGPPIMEALSYKTKHWEYEKEYRLISFGSNEYFSIKGILKRVIFGPRCSKEDQADIRRLLQVNIPTAHAIIDYCTQKVSLWMPPKSRTRAEQPTGYPT